MVLSISTAVFPREPSMEDDPIVIEAENSSQEEEQCRVSFWNRSADCGAFENVVDLVPLLSELRFLLLRATSSVNTTAISDRSTGLQDYRRTFRTIFANTSTWVEGKDISMVTVPIAPSLVGCSCSALDTRHLSGIVDSPKLWPNTRSVFAPVASRFCWEMVQLLKHSRVIPLTSCPIRNPEPLFDMDGVDCMSTFIISSLSNWFRRPDPAHLPLQPRYDGFTGLLLHSVTEVSEYSSAGDLTYGAVLQTSHRDSEMYILHEGGNNTTHDVPLTDLDDMANPTMTHSMSSDGEHGLGQVSERHAEGGISSLDSVGESGQNEGGHSPTWNDDMFEFDGQSVSNVDYLEDERQIGKKTASIWDEDEECYEFDFASQLAAAAYDAEDSGDLNSMPYFTPDPAKYGDLFERVGSQTPQHGGERQTMPSMQSMLPQPYIRWYMRPVLVDFLLGIHFMQRLCPETLYLTLNIVDHYVSSRIVYVHEYQLLGCAALWIAAKFHDPKTRIPTINDLANLCGNRFYNDVLRRNGSTSFSLSPPTEATGVQHVARFLMEITLYYPEFVGLSSASIALAALTLARFIGGKSHRKSSAETEECFKIIHYLDTRLAGNVDSDELSETLVRKYSYDFYSNAAEVVLQYYLQGGRYVRPTFSMTPSLATVSD
ncbi:Cyclin N-terminal domain-containing protein [Mycena venus]|uniref:Cyclin N-terminal domain-containing protein n=1 Tax=Mycena venus TaxID=2733690 RepID=A0A8H6X5M0_9AGAR|nr:Cyclin N-terminal domain-containing protein [Mycena venus]